MGKAAKGTDNHGKQRNDNHHVEQPLGLACNGDRLGKVPSRSSSGLCNEDSQPHRSESSKSAHLHDSGHETSHGNGSTRINVGNPEVYRSSTRLEQEANHGQEHADTVERFTAIEARGKEMRRTGSAVNQSHTVEEYGAEDGARDEVLEHAFVRVHVFAADTDQGVNREASEFHADEKGKEINRLRHETSTARRKHQQSVSLAALVLLVAKRPLEAGNPEEGAEHDRCTENLADRVHGIQVEHHVCRAKVVGGHAGDDEQRRHPGENLVLVLVLDERFRGKRNKGANGDNDNRQ